MDDQDNIKKLMLSYGEEGQNSIQTFVAESFNC